MAVDPSPSDSSPPGEAAPVTAGSARRERDGSSSRAELDRRLGGRRAGAGAAVPAGYRSGAAAPRSSGLVAGYVKVAKVNDNVNDHGPCSLT
jgi:hypothetical protein